MPYRSKTNHNGVPNVKLPMPFECVHASSDPDAIYDASLRDTVIVPKSSVCVSSDATSDVTSSSPSNYTQVPGSSDSDYVDGSHVSLDASEFCGVSLEACSTSSCQFTCPDLNPLFDVFDELDHLLANLSFRTAVDFSAFAHDQSIGISLSLSSTCSSSIACFPATCRSTLSSGVNDELSLSSTCSSSIVCLPASCGSTLSNGANDQQLVQEVLFLCCHITELLTGFFAYYQLYEVACLDEIEDMRAHLIAGVQWNPDFILSCFGEFDVFFEHFASSSFPRIIEVFPD